MDKKSIENSMQEVFGKKSHKKMIAGALIAIIIIIAIVAFYYNNTSALPNISPSPQATNRFKTEDVAFVSQSDLEFQQTVKSITGYDWINFLNADGSEKAKLSALLFLANELDALEANFNFVKRSVGLSKSELPSQLNAADKSKENLLKLIVNVKSAENVFAAKGLESAKVRASRLVVLQSYFNRYSLPEGPIKADAKGVFAENLELTANDYSGLISLMIAKYNLFVAV